FGDEPDSDRDLAHGRYDDDEARGVEVEGEEGPAEPAERDEIDPELEEEIRREAEEIAELEREMGLRGTTEARPRRGDDREAEPGARGPGGRYTRGRGMSKPPI